MWGALCRPQLAIQVDFRLMLIFQGTRVCCSAGHVRFGGMLVIRRLPSGSSVHALRRVSEVLARCSELARKLSRRSWIRLVI